MSHANQTVSIHRCLNSVSVLYWLLAVVSAVMFLLSFVLAKNELGAAGEVAVH